VFILFLGLYEFIYFFNFIIKFTVKSYFTKNFNLCYSTLGNKPLEAIVIPIALEVYRKPVKIYK
jgi:hypothetical protein